ncbi:YkyA family protein [Alkalibacterium thalassium]|uniref:Putative cell-wall binding lipoprotein n=1 Tax=Alkalibacterium thalassium TaxID=426701 RepID=A0A1G8V415_9LACT|nr:YkyA family protein [Alkalibacterium thalassium]SDJ60812.1 Putative cell-wall binding lipoprotein [Alkalibacterium thalassium]
MIRKRWTYLAVSSTALLLAGCDDGENLEDMQEATQELDRLRTETADELNHLYDLETDLQNSFSETLESDDELTTLGDGSSPVFENIESREAVLENIAAHEEEMSEHQSTLDTYEGELLDQSEIDAVMSDVYTFTDQLSQYRENYQAALSSQDSYFVSLSENGATYEDFVDGIRSINDEHDELREYLLVLDETLVDFGESLDQLHTSIDNQLTEDE